MLKDIAPKGRARSVRRARSLRAEMTLPEVLMWKALRNQPNGLKFRRQHPSGPYILDFFCSDARLAIEIDGEAHSRGDRPKRDEARDRWLSEAGIETLRIPAADVLKDVEIVIRGILVRAVDRLPLHHPASPGGPPPRGKLGEDL
jgi:very-short-patch-repair endonuclease